MVRAVASGSAVVCVGSSCPSLGATLGALAISKHMLTGLKTGPGGVWQAVLSANDLSLTLNDIVSYASGQPLFEAELPAQQRRGCSCKWPRGHASQCSRYTDHLR